MRSSRYSPSAGCCSSPAAPRCSFALHSGSCTAAHVTGEHAASEQPTTSYVAAGQEEAPSERTTARSEPCPAQRVPWPPPYPAQATARSETSCKRDPRLPARGSAAHPAAPLHANGLRKRRRGRTATPACLFSHVRGSALPRYRTEGSPVKPPASAPSLTLHTPC